MLKNNVFMVEAAKSKVVALATIFSLVVSMIVPGVASAATIFSDGFEAGSTNWVTTTGTKWNVGGNSASSHTGSKRAVVNGNTSDGQEDKGQMTTSIDTTDSGDISLSFWYRIPTSTGLEDADVINVEWSTDGSTWNTVASYDSSDETDTWVNENITLSSGAANQTNLRIRFSAILNAGNDEFFLDDVVISGNTTEPANNAPVITDISIAPSSPDTDDTLEVTVTATDADDDTLVTTYQWKNNGTEIAGATGASLNLGTAGNGDKGDSLTVEVTVSDGTDTDTETATAVVIGNSAPIANEDAYGVDEDTTLTVNSGSGVLNNDTDADGDSFTAILVSQTSNGTTTLNSDGSFEYIPGTEFSGEDSFTYKANDGSDSEIVTVTITVDSENDIPEGATDAYTVDEDTTLTITAPGVLSNDDDNDGDDLTVTLSDDVSNGTLDLEADGSFVYTPNTNFNGSDSFTYTINDGTGESGEVVVNLTVNAVNDAPIANGQSVSTEEDTAVLITLTGSDIDGDSLTYEVVANPTGGELSGTIPNLTYTPNTGFDGPDSFTFKVNDGSVDSEVATVSITVNEESEEEEENTAPVATNYSTSTKVNEAVTFALPATDADSNPLTFATTSNPILGLLSFISFNQVTYTPAATGTYSFMFRANDGLTDSNEATVEIVVTDADTTPTQPASQCADGIDNDGDGQIDLNDSDCANADDNNESTESSGGGGGGGGGGSNNDDDDDTATTTATTTPIITITPPAAGGAPITILAGAGTETGETEVGTEDVGTTTEGLVLEEEATTTEDESDIANASFLAGLGTLGTGNKFIGWLFWLIVLALIGYYSYKKWGKGEDLNKFNK